MNIAIVGFYGKLGKANYDLISSNPDINVAFGVSRSASTMGDDYQGIKVYKNIFDAKEICDGVIDFSNRANVKSVVEYCCDKKIPLVMGTTG